jgi:hypothetical protein
VIIQTAILTVAFLRLLQPKANEPLRFSGKCNRTHAFFLLHLFEKRKVCLLSVALAEKRNGLVLTNVGAHPSLPKAGSMIAADSHQIPPFDAPQQDANQQVSLVSSRVSHRARCTPRFQLIATVL